MGRIAVTCDLPPEATQEFIERFDVVEQPLRGASLLDIRSDLDGCEAVVLTPQGTPFCGRRGALLYGLP